MDKQHYTVSILNTENHIYEYEVIAFDEEEAGNLAWDEAEESYHGPKQIISIY
jgi:hypothetical protein